MITGARHERFFLKSDAPPAARFAPELCLEPVAWLGKLKTFPARTTVASFSFHSGPRNARRNFELTIRTSLPPSNYAYTFPEKNRLLISGFANLDDFHAFYARLPLLVGGVLRLESIWLFPSGGNAFDTLVENSPFFQWIKQYLSMGETAFIDFEEEFRSRFPQGVLIRPEQGRHGRDMRFDPGAERKAIWNGAMRFALGMTPKRIAKVDFDVSVLLEKNGGFSRIFVIPRSYHPMARRAWAERLMAFNHGLLDQASRTPDHRFRTE